MVRKTLDIDLNRVEGDLEFQLDLEDGVVVDARCIGTLYRGFEQILIGRAPMDALVITPRVCGICGTAHLYAGVQALEQLGKVVPPEHAVLIRNLCLMTENVQSDLRQTFLFFTPDLCHPRYQTQPLAKAVDTAFAPMRGTAVRSVLEVTRRLLGIVAIFGGQWPHSTYMLPGGVTTPATPKRLLDVDDILSQTINWFERDVLGMKLDAWLQLNTAAAFFEQMDKGGGLLALFTQMARDIGLHQGGAGSVQMLSYGVGNVPGHAPGAAPSTAWPSGVFNGESGQVEKLDQSLINEHVRHSWFLPYEGGRHPWQGETIPDLVLGGDRYTWAKAPRYGQRVMQTGPLAELLVANDPLVVGLFQQEGDNTWLRQFARLRRAARLLVEMRQTLQALHGQLDTPHFIDPKISEWPDGESYGLVEAARGALGHWLKIKNGVIERYQIVTPTAWNASPKDSAGQRGHWEESVIGVRLEDEQDPLEIGHIVRSHDPCLVCTVHFVGQGKKVVYGV